MTSLTPPQTEEGNASVALERACQASTAEWQLHLEQLFNNARDRFPDVVWELVNEGDTLPSDEVWGHKAIVYARAPPTFQARYFSFRPPPVASPSPYTASPMPAQSAVSLSAMSLPIDAPSPARSPSPNGYAMRTLSPLPTTPGNIMRLTTSIASALFCQELEYLYTGKSFGDAFEFLFDSPEKRDEGDGEKNRLEKLRKDLVFMWRSRLYSDVRLQLSGNLSSSSTAQDDPTATAVFSSHRFILVSRSPYFRSQLLGHFAPPTPAPGQLFTVTLPSPPFTPASLHFTLGYMYTGTLSFSHRTYDLDTAFHILRAATYLSLSSLYSEIEARIIEEMMHGLFHAYLPFDEYEKLTGGKWGASGDKCRQCARRAPRVLEFAMLEDVKNDRLANGARRALVGLFGDGWCTSEFAAIPQKTREALLRGVQKRTVPLNVFPLLYAAQRAVSRLNSAMEPWAHTVREMVLGARKAIDELMCDKAEECFTQPEWLSVMDADGGRFEDGEKVEWVMDCLRRGLNEKNAALVYQTIVSSILLRPHPEDPSATILSTTSSIRQQVEMTRMDIIKWMRRRWGGVLQEGGFDNLEGWALKEISHELELSVEDLIRPPPNSSLKGPPTRTGLRPTIGKRDGEGDTASITSLRSSVLNRNSVKGSGAATSSLASSASSVRSSRTSVTTTSRASATPRARQSGASVQASTTSSRAPLLSASVRASSTSIRAPSQASNIPRTSSQASVRAPSRTARPSLSNTSNRKSAANSTIPPSERPKSAAGSVRSHASTIRKSSVPTSRPTSDASTVFKTARSELTSGRESVASNATAGPSKPIPRSRRSSISSSVSIASSITSTASRATKKTNTKNKQSPPVPKRPISTASARSNVSTISTTNRLAAAKAAAAKANEKRESFGRPPVPAAPRKNGTTPNGADSTDAASASSRGKGRAMIAGEHNTALPMSTASDASTLRPKNVKGVVRKESNDTITTTTTNTTNTTNTTTTTTPGTPRPPKPTRPPPRDPDAPSPQPPNRNLGATLNIGIPCIISSKRSRFRAFARYIGELEGEPGSWVGVEVPVGEGWGADKLDGRLWNDGSWGGRRYFEIGNIGEWEEGDERRKRRRGEGGGPLSRHQTLKREGEQLNLQQAKRLRSVSPSASDVSAMESRGLFVRPQQVIYVVDAESDL